MAFDLTLQPAEFVVFQSRRHFWFLLKDLAVLAVALLGVPVLLQISAPFLVTAFGPIAAQLIGALLIGLFITVSLMVLAVTFKWLNERVVLTNQRVIAASRAELIWSHATAIPICDVQHTYVAELGVGPILGFGDIAVKSAAEANPIDFFYGLPDVEDFASLVMAAVEACSQERRT